VTTIEVLPDDVLLAIFDFFVIGNQDRPINGAGNGMDLSSADKEWAEWWQPLVHVCRRWRTLVFDSPHRLDLQLYCTFGTVTRKNLDIWPALPLLIKNDDVFHTPVDDLTSVFEHSNRIRQINLGCDTISQFEKVWAAMQVPFPELTNLILGRSGDTGQSPSETVTVLLDSFLGGSVPRLRHLIFIGIPFPGLQTLLLSATHLVVLHLSDVPHSGCISPEEMVTCLSVLTSLRYLSLGFESPQSCPDQESGRYAPPPPTRPVLPTLMRLWFKGANEYLEDFLARIDAPRLYQLEMTFFNDIFFDTPQLIQFIGRTLKFNPPNEAHVTFDIREASFRLQSRPSNFTVTILCGEPDWQLSALALICTSFLPFLSATETLYIEEYLYSNSKLDWKNGIENTEWLELLFLFTAVKNLYLTKEFESCISPALQELTGGRMTEVLPTLQNVFLEGFRPSEPVQEGIGQFISGRQLTNHPITISSWDRNPKQGRSLEVDG